MRMQTAALRIFKFWQTGVTTHKKLYAELKLISSPEVIKSIRNGQYNLALRQASFQNNLKSIKVLLKFREQISLDVNSTTSKNQTAFDLANDVKVKSLLAENGSKPGHTITAAARK